MGEFIGQRFKACRGEVNSVRLLIVVVVGGFIPSLNPCIPGKMEIPCHETFEKERLKI